MCLGKAGAEGKKFARVVFVDETSGGEFGAVGRREGFGKLALVVIVVSGGCVKAADVNDYGACCEEGGIARTKERGGGEAGEEAEEKNGEGFVSVKMAAGGTC